jgi:spore coat polysaccharide biosynthesis protein SpsF
MKQAKNMVIAIVQARMNSKRLPGKSMKEILGKPMIYYTFYQLKFSKLIDEMMLATSTQPENDEMARFVSTMGVKVFRGSEDDVLGRFVEATKGYGDDCVIVRITGDEPLIDPAIVDAVIKDHLKKQADYTSTKIIRTIPQGMDLEVFPKKVLLKTAELANADFDKEHITPYIYNHPNDFKIYAYQSKKEFSIKPVLTVDVIEEFELIRKIIEGIYKEGKPMKSSQILNFIKKNKLPFEPTKT